MPKASESPLRLMICIPTLGPGGAERQVRIIAPALARNGVDVAIFSRMTPTDAAQLKTQGVRCFPIRCSGNYNPKILLELMAAMRRHRSQVVQTLLPQMDVIGGIAARILRRKWVLSERLSAPGYRSDLKNIVRQKIGAKADAIHANSTAGLEVWPDHPRRQVIGNGIDVAAIQNAARIAGSTEDASPNEPRIIAIGRLYPVKAFHILLRAVGRIRQDLPKLSVCIAGEGPLRKALEAEAVMLGLGETVRLVGLRSDVWNLLGNATMFVATSTCEGHPNAVLEAAAARIPLILSDIPTHRQAAGDNGALFFQPENEVELAAAIHRLRSDKEGADARAAAAFRHVEQLTPDETALRLKTLFNSLIDPS